jgi:MurNAc alpha-1-phosphate uridylyltransferase
LQARREHVEESTMPAAIEKAFVLAAGLGTRMRPLTDHMPKPLVQLAGKALIDHALDRIGHAGLPVAVVNVHYMADAIERHLAERLAPSIVISDEREVLLETGGGVLKALPLIGDGPFVVHNSDSVWHETGSNNIERLIERFEPAAMDALLLLAKRATSLGYAGRGDFHLRPDGRISRPARGEEADYVFAGVSIATPRLLRECPQGPFSLNLPWDRAIAEGRLFGLPLDGTWMHVGDPEALAAAEDFLARRTG